MFDKKLSFTVAIALMIVSCAATYSVNEYIHHLISERTKQAIGDVEPNHRQKNQFKTDRLKGYKLIKPLVYSEQNTESPQFADIKGKLNRYIEQLKTSKKLMSASVYLKDFDQGDWMCINDKETFYPGSLIKVPGMITFLKMEESNPGVLNKKLPFGTPHKAIPNQTYNSKQIQSGREYTVRELLKYMIAFSDNNATYLLNKNVDLNAFHQLFVDLDIPRFNADNSKITARNFSMFLNVLFNASYLSKENSEFAVELLQECDFKLGMVKGLPVNTVVAHKFGEMGDESTRQLHESGLIYINDTPYLLTIMTKGYDVNELPEIVSTMSKMVYADFIKKGTK